MTMRKDLKYRRIDIAKAAAERWHDRTQTRIKNRDMLRDIGVRGVENKARIERFARRAAGSIILGDVGSPRPVGLPIEALIERVIGGKDERRKLPNDDIEVAAGLPVARMVDLPGAGFMPVGVGTGFMVSRDLLMTNNHVIETPEMAQDMAANFGHDYVADGGLLGGQMFTMNPDRFFVTNRDLDYTLIAVEKMSDTGTDLALQNFHPLIAETGKILIGKGVNIIQHPDGMGKHYATEGNTLVDRLENFLHYRTDTEGGSSGSPVFSELWEVVALHHSGLPLVIDNAIIDVNGEPWDGADPDEVEWVANEGVRISRILAHLASVDLAGSKAGLREAMLAAGAAANAAAKAGPGLPKGAIDNVERVTLVQGAKIEAPTDERDDPMILTTDGSRARTVVHVHGNGDVYTGTVSHRRDAPQADPKADESTRDIAVLERTLTFDPQYGRRRGYDGDFLKGHSVDLPKVLDDRLAEMHRDRYGNPVILDYHHFSLSMNAAWLLQMWSAVNVDYSPDVRWDMDRSDFGSDRWIHDMRLSDALQLDNDEIYGPARKFDRGHVVRRDDNAWGATREEVIFANSDTFHWTNCTPQHENFNRSNLRGVWGKLENHIARQAGAVDNRITLFAGPVLHPDRCVRHDFGGGTYRVPLDFWKVVIVATPKTRGSGTDLHSFGFLLEQQKAIIDHGLERFDPDTFEAQQRPLTALADKTGLVFPTNVMKADVFAKADGAANHRLTDPGDIDMG